MSDTRGSRAKKERTRIIDSSRIRIRKSKKSSIRRIFAKVPELIVEIGKKKAKKKSAVNSGKRME